MSLQQTLARHRAIAFAGPSVGTRPLEGRLFLKDVASADEEWVHPLTGEKVKFSKDELKEIAEATNRYASIQGPIPFPDGHTTLSARNLGYWHRFLTSRDGVRLLGVVEAGSDEIAEKVGSTIRGVSMFLEKSVKDSKGGDHQNVMTHVAATEYPVVTGQDNFVALDRNGTTEKVPLFISGIIAASSGTSDDKKTEDRMDPEMKKKCKDEEMSAKHSKYLAAIASALGVQLAMEEDDEAAGKKIEEYARKVAAAAKSLAGEKIEEEKKPDEEKKKLEEEAMAAKALARKKGDEASALSTRLCAVEAELTVLRDEKTTRDKVEIDGIVDDAKRQVLACSRMPMPAEDEQDARDLWGRGEKDRARRVLSRAVSAAGGTSTTIPTGVTPAPRGQMQKPGELSQDDLEKASVKEVVTALARDGVKAEISQDGKQFRVDGHAQWRSLARISN